MTLRNSTSWAIAQLASLVLAALLLGLPLVAQQLDQSNWGKNSPGVELGTHEDPRQRTASGTTLTYNILGKGFPSGIPYSVWGWPVGKKPQKLIDGASFDKRGVLVCSGKPGFCSGQGTDDAINIRATASLGEPKRFAVVSPDGKIAGFAEAVPFPITASDHNCKLSIVRMEPLAEVVIVRVSGFAPNESLALTGNVDRGSPAPSPTAAADGSWQGVVEPNREGQNSGMATVKLSGKACSPALTFNWGEGSNKPQ